MGLLLGTLILFGVIAFVSNALIDGYTEDMNVPKWAKIIYKAILGFVLLGILILLGKCGCSSAYEYTPTGETTLEHYEPR